jgi:phage terminase small subunit
MSALSNHRRELFAQLLVQGFTAVDAHEKAGFRRNDGNASALSRHPEIEARIMEIKEELTEPKGEPLRGPMALGTSIIAARANVTPESLMDQAEAILVKAMGNNQLSAAVSALKEKGILSGRRIERTEIGGPGEFDHMSDEELLAGLRERFARLEATLAIGNRLIALNGSGADKDIAER